MYLNRLRKSNKCNINILLQANEMVSTSSFAFFGEPLEMLVVDK